MNKVLQTKRPDCLEIPRPESQSFRIELDSTLPAPCPREACPRDASNTWVGNRGSNNSFGFTAGDPLLLAL